MLMAVVTHTSSQTTHRSCTLSDLHVLNQHSKAAVHAKQWFRKKLLASFIQLIGLTMCVALDLIEC